MKKSIGMMMLSGALVLGMSTFASAQYNGGTYQNGVWVGQRDASGAYQRGVHDGQEDARRGRTTSQRADRYHNDAERQAYDQGYSAGYQSVQNNGGDANNGRVYAPGQVYQNGRERRRDKDCDADDPCGQAGGVYGNNGGYYGNNRGYGNGMQVAQQMGFTDGQREGASDRATGHSFRPTEDTGYRLATNGYQAQFGSRDQYKAWYRSAYQQGYQQGYNGNGNGYGRRWPR